MTDSPLDRLLEQGVDFETIGKRLECGISISEQEAAHRAPLDGFYELCDLTDEERQPPEFIVDGLLPVGLTFLSGAPKIRKSFLALQLAGKRINATLRISTSKVQNLAFPLVLNG